MNQSEFETLFADETKSIIGDISWASDEDHSPCVEFRVEVRSDAGWPLFVHGSYNPLARALSYVLVHRGSGRIYGLDLGKDHHNPTCQNVGETHKHRWNEGFRDKEAYVPVEITAGAGDPVETWKQFCVEAKIQHQGILLAPPAQEESI